MTGAALLSKLTAAGLRLRAEGDNLIASPSQALTDDLRALLKAHKEELLAALRPDGRTVPDDWGYIPEDLTEMDELLRQLASLEDWPEEVLEARLRERRRMALANICPALAALRAAVQNALAGWPDAPSTRAEVVLCNLTVH